MDDSEKVGQVAFGGVGDVGDLPGLWTGLGTIRGRAIGTNDDSGSGGDKREPVGIAKDYIIMETQNASLSSRVERASRNTHPM